MSKIKSKQTVFPEGTVNTVLISSVAGVYRSLSKEGLLEGIPFAEYGSTICALLIAITLSWYFGAYVFDEIRSAKNRPYDHVYTRIRGVWYDFATFTHPGGPIALNLVRNRDGTALFESHHLISNMNMEKILAKYKVPKNVAEGLRTIDPNDDGAHYVWEGYKNDAFVKEANELVRSYLEKIAKHYNISLYAAAKMDRQRSVVLLVLGAIFLSTLPAYFNGVTWGLFAAPLMIWVFGVNFWHDALHFSFVNDWRINAFTPYLTPVFSSPWLWYHQHVIGHHAYTNIGHKDPDLAHAMHIQRDHESVKWRKVHATQGTYKRLGFLWTIAVGLGLNLANDIKANMKSSYNNTVGYNKLSKPRLAAHIFGRLFYVWFIFARPFMLYSGLKAVIWATYPIASFSLLFMLNSQINHLTEDCSTASDTNFLKHQIVTSQNFGADSKFCFVMSGGLNMQIEHHMFPFLNHCHLPRLAPSVKALCKKHGVRYNEATGYRDAFNRHMKHTLELSKPPVKTE